MNSIHFIPLTPVCSLHQEHSDGFALGPLGRDGGGVDYMGYTLIVTISCCVW